LANLKEALLGEERHGGNVDTGDVYNEYCVTGSPTESGHVLDQIAINAALMMRRGYAYGNLNSATNPVRTGQDGWGDTDYVRES